MPPITAPHSPVRPPLSAQPPVVGKRHLLEDAPYSKGPDRSGLSGSIREAPTISRHAVVSVRGFG